MTPIEQALLELLERVKTLEKAMSILIMNDRDRAFKNQLER